MKIKLYEKFHGNTKAQHKLISDKNFTYRIILEVINKYVKSNKTVLDIGCGAGTLCFYMADKGNNVVGVDISEKAIKSCRETANNLGLSNKTLFRTLSFPSDTIKEKFDIVLLTEVIEHIKDDNLALKKIYKLLNKNGIAIISTPSKNAPLYKLGLATEFDKRVGHLRRYSVDELVNMCKKNGFEILETKKTEGLLRNFLFLNPVAGKSLKLIKYFVADIVNVLDNICLKMFGESDIIVIVRKPQ